MNKSDTSLITYIGTRESMGAVFAVIKGTSRVIMDFGAPFDPEKSNYRKKDDNWIKDKLDLGLLPKIEGLYPQRYLKGYDLLPAERSPYETAVFVSHLHLDHMANIGALDPSVKVYLSENARRLELALEETGSGVDTIGRDYDCFHEGECITVGDIRVYPIINSSYSYNMYGFLVETDDLKVGYTADLSLSNEHPEMVQKEMEIFRDKKIDVLYCDCCNFDDNSLIRFFGSTDPEKIIPSSEVPEGMLTWQQHYQKIKKLYRREKGLIVFNNYEREMLDVQLINKWAEENGRKMVLSPSAGYLYYRFFDTAPYIYPDERLSGKQWYTELLENGIPVTFDEVMQHPDNYYLQLPYQDIDLLEKLPGENGLYIHAEGDPFSSSEIEIMKEKVARAGFVFASYDDPQYYQHGYPSQICYFVSEIDPKVVIGYHGRHPERIKAKNGYNLVPEPYKQYYLLADKLVKKED